MAERVRGIEDRTGQADEGTGEGEFTVEAPGSGAVPGETGFEGCGGGKLLSPERRRCAVEQAREKYRLSERKACRLLGQWRGTQRYESNQRADEDELTKAVITLASQYGRYGYKKIT